MKLQTPAMAPSSDTKSAFLNRTRLRTAWVQALRVMVACAVAYGLSHVLALQQGYWSVFTVLVVMQASTGATAGAAVDRLVATVAGALLGAVAALITPHEPLAIGIALVCTTGVGSFAAALHPRLRIAALTASIVILTRPMMVPVEVFVLNRIAEITLGGVIGVLVSLLVLPRRPGHVLLGRLAGVAEAMVPVLEGQAGALESGEGFSSTEATIALRQALVGAETLLAEVKQERSLRLARGAFPEALPRTLWRVRNDIAQIGRVLDAPFPEDALRCMGPQGAHVLRQEALFVQACARALREGALGDWPEAQQALDAFDAAFAEMRRGEAARPVDFDDIGRLFGLSNLLHRLRQDMGDLGERITEILRGEAEEPSES